MPYQLALTNHQTDLSAYTKSFNTFQLYFYNKFTFTLDIVIPPLYLVYKRKILAGQRYKIDHRCQNFLCPGANQKEFHQIVKPKKRRLLCHHEKIKRISEKESACKALKKPKALIKRTKVLSN